MRKFDLSIPEPVYVSTDEESEKWISVFLNSLPECGHSFGLDSETTGLDIINDRPIIWSISNGVYRLCLPASQLRVWKERVLENPEINFDLSNPKFDAHMFFNVGIDITKAGQLRDTVTQSWLLDENKQGRHGLKETTLEWLGRVSPTFEDTFGKMPRKKLKPGEEKVTPGDLIIAALNDPNRFFSAIDYASLDAYNSTTLRKVLDEELKKVILYPGYTLYDYYYQMEVHFTKVLWKMERFGFVVDLGYFKSLKGSIEARILEIETEINTIAGEFINVRSPPQLRRLFFDILGKTPIKMTDGGTTGNKQPSTDEEVLETWAGQGDRTATLMMEHRSISKILGTYINGLQDWVDQKCRIHTTLNQHGTVTGRLSSRDPNLMNLPRPSEDKFRIRDAFISGFRKRLLVADYGQLEMRLLAHFSADKKMIKAILEDIDIHCLTVSEMYGIPYEEVMAAKKHEGDLKKGKRTDPLTPREEELLFLRQAAKATGFGIVYGIGGPHLAHNLTRELNKTVTPEEGIELIKKWFSVFPEAHGYIEGQKALIDREGRVQTLMGRFRTLGDVKSMSKKDRAGAHRMGVNARIQGSAADIVKAAMMKCVQDPELNSYGVDLILQIHDELIWECPDNAEIVKSAMNRAKYIMEHPFDTDLLVPLPVEIGSGYSWATAK